jgi:uncharacterized protein (TIGR02757 family)
MQGLKTELDSIYRRFNRAEYIAADPLAPVLAYADPRDQEVVALVCASLAFGNVKTILGSIDKVLAALPPRPRDLPAVAESQLRHGLREFRHRYISGAEMCCMLAGAAELMREHGTLAAAFDACWRESPQLEQALGRYVRALCQGEKNYLLPDPALGSACKRWMMLLRWMVRSDDVDPGTWRTMGCAIQPAHLMVPVDTHMLKIGTALGFTRRKQGSLLTARDITEAFRQIRPRDPVRYDFALTRFGIRREPKYREMLERWAAAQGK